jgi:hypothetical protein
MAIPSSNRNAIQTQIKVDNAAHATTADSATSSTSSSYAATASVLLGSVISASYALTASYAMNGGGGGGGSTQSLQQVVNTGNSIVNYGGVGTASLQSVNFVNNRALYINNDIYPTIRIVDNTNSSNNLQIDIDTISLDGVSYNWSDIVNNINTSSFVTTGSNIFIGNQTISGSLFQSGTFYPDIIDWFSSSIQMGTGSYILTTNNDGITQYDTYANIASALSPYISINTSSLVTTSSFNSFTGSYTTGSFTGSFTGSLLGTSSISLTTDKINVIINSSSAIFHPVFVDDLGIQTPYLDGDFSYIPSTNQLSVGGITSSLFGTSSWATNALTSSYVNSLNQNVRITGSLVVSGSGATIELYGDKIIAGAVGGQEGGEILLAKPSISSSLTGSGITIDSYQNQLRFFEQGGNARGAFLDITSLGAGVGTDIRIAQQLESQQAMGSTIKGYNIGCPVPVLAFNSIGLTSGVTSYTAIYIHTTTTITGVKWYQQTQGNYTANNYNGVGLYSTSGGTLTLVATSSNDGNIWKASGTALASKAFAATYVANAGIYYIGALYSNSAQVTQPTVGFAGSALAGSSNLGLLDYTNNNKTNGTAGSGLTTLATSVAASGITLTQYRFAFYLY